VQKEQTSCMILTCQRAMEVQSIAHTSPTQYWCSITWRKRNIKLEHETIQELYL